MAGGQDPNQPYVDPNQQHVDPNQQHVEPGHVPTHHHGYYDDHGNWVALDPHVPAEGEDLQQYADEENAVVKSAVPMAIAFVGHFIFLFIATLIVFAVNEYAEVPPLDAELLNQELAPLPEEPEPEPIEIPEEEPIVEDPVTEPEVEVTMEETPSEDPTEKPLENEDLTPAESPNPNKNPNSAMGFGGGGGGPGGGGPGGGGMFGGRRGVADKPNAERVDAALQWLADHQNKLGFWSPDKYLDDSIRFELGADATRNIDFNDHVPRDSDIGWESAKVGLTGLALLAFAGDGHTHLDGKFRHTVKAGLKWLLKEQDPEGFFGTLGEDEAVYNHAICAMALAELYLMSGEPKLKNPTQSAVDWIIKAQNPGQGWRYEVQPKENDSSVTAWMVLALKSAKLADMKFDEKEVYIGANNWYDTMVGQNEEGYDVTGYRIRGLGAARLENAQTYTRPPSMDACNVMVRLFTAEHVEGNRKNVNNMANLINKNPPTWLIGGDEANGPWQIDLYYWYYASLALYQLGGSYWGKWETNMIKPVLLKYQRAWHEKDIAKFGEDIVMPAEHPREGRARLDEHGSWDPVGAWGTAGGRVYSTAINALTLEVYYRYKRLSDMK